MVCACTGLPVYDRRTPRFDQPYITGNCAGEGICGTCTPTTIALIPIGIACMLAPRAFS